MGKLRDKLGRRSDRQRGAALAEFAIVMPLLILLLLGMIEFGWALAQEIDVRHKAREALRLLVVDEPMAAVEARVCNDDIIASSDVTVIAVDTDTDPGSAASVTVTANLRQLTGMFGPFWGSSPTVSSTVEGRVEQETTTSMPDNLAPCP